MAISAVSTRHIHLLVTILFVSLSCVAQCGLQNDFTIRVAPAYNKFSPPALRQSYTDPVFGCAVTRLSDGQKQAGQAIMHEYSNMSAVNASDTLIELLDSTGQWFISDLSGNVVVPNLPWGGGSGARWAPDDPRSLYYRDSNTLLKATIALGCARDCIVSSKVLRKFPEYSTISFGGGEGDMQDADHIVIVAVCNGASCASDTKEIFVYTISSNTKSSVLNIGHHAFDNAQLTPSNQVVVNWGVNGAQDCAFGPCYFGFELFSSSMQYVRSLTPGAQHSVEVGFRGKEYLVHVDADGVVCPGNHQGIAVIDVNIGRSSAVCYLSYKLPWGASIHVGGSKNGTGWVVVSHTDYDVPGSASLPLAQNWSLPTNPINNGPSFAGYWGLGSNEISLLKVDGSVRRRLLHHRSRPNGADYWKLPRASISRDGKFVVFDSDYATGSADVYISRVN